MPRNDDKPPRFKLLLPRRESELLKFFNEPSLIGYYLQSLANLEYQYGTWDEVAVRMTTRELQLCWVVQEMRRMIEESYEFDCRGLDEMRSRFITPATEKKFDRAEDDAYSDDDDEADGDDDEDMQESKPTRTSRQRKLITDAMKAKVVKMTKAGKSVAEIAKAVGISLPSVMNIKKAMGLVKKR